MWWPGTVQVHVALGATDLRKSINGLSQLTEAIHGHDPFSGELFAFANRRRDQVKVLYWDRSGFCVWHKRLERGRFRWPDGSAGIQDLSARDLGFILEGLRLPVRDAHRAEHYASTL